MGRVLTNFTSLRATIEASTGVLPGSPQWWVVEFDSIGAYGATITTVARRPIGTSRGRKKGSVVDLESSVEFETDLTIDAFTRFAEGFFFSEYANLEFDLRDGTGTIPPPADTTADTFTVDALSALLESKIFYAASGARTLLHAKGYTNAANNGVHVMAADPALSATDLSVATNLVTETPPTNATLKICGVEIDDGDVTFTLSGSTATLVSAAHVSDWAALGIFAGMRIHIGGIDTDGTVVNAFDDAATDDNYGYARVASVSGNTLNLDKLDPNLTATDTNTGILQVLFGQFVRDVDVTADADDTRFLERTYQFEATFPNLGNGGATRYEYAIGNFANEITVNVGLNELATLSMGFIGTNSDPITGTRKTGASSAISVLRDTGFSTAVDLVSITTDVISSVSDVCFKSLTISVLNNVSPEKCLGTLGATFVNAGLFEVNIDGQMAFTSESIIEAIRNNTTITFSAIFRNEDGAIAFDMPELTLGGGGREYVTDATVLVNVTGQSFTSETFGFNASTTIFPVVPQAA